MQAQPSTTPRFLANDASLNYESDLRRVRPPEDTRALLEPLLEDAGITRIAHVTGLDRVGIPVVMVVRPNARSLSVSQGKGADTAAAEVSGIMESVELHHAERPTLPLRMAAHVDVKGRERIVDPEALPISRASSWSPDRRLPWAQARDLHTDEPWWVPYELVHADASYPLVPGSGCFMRSTNGLASGNCRAEAVLHGICEVIERDSLALWDHATPEEQAATRIDPAALDDETVHRLLTMYEGAGIDVLAWDATSDVQMPVARVVIVDRESDSVLKPMPAAFGAGCDPDRATAMIRALAEAAQSRLTAIAGSRDDLTRERYRSFQHADALAAYRMLVEQPAERDVSNLPDWGADDPVTEVQIVLDRLAAVGFEQVLTMDLTLEGWPISVARVIVPGLEGPTESPWYRPGERVRRLLEARR